jgi:hypothetical protein
MSDPVVPATDSINYVFSFTNAAAASYDAVVGVSGGLHSQEMLLFFKNVSSVVPLAGYQPMITQPGPVNDNLYNHPNLLFAFDLAFTPSKVLKTIYTAAQMQQLVLILSNFGAIVTNGLT